ncbi:MAG: PHP domain-containing protein [archaeon]
MEPTQEELRALKYPYLIGLESLAGKPNAQGQNVVRWDGHSHTCFTRPTIVDSSKRNRSRTWIETGFDFGKGVVKSVFRIRGKPVTKSDAYKFYFVPFPTPKEIYENAIDAGVDHISITDLNTMEGCKELLSNREFRRKHPDLEERFIPGAELETRMPKKTYDFHTLVYEPNERQFERVMQLRENAVDLKHYCDDQGLILALAHPFTPWFAKNQVTNQEDFEELVELFDILEARNGITIEEHNKALEDYCPVAGKGMTGGTDSSIGKVGTTGVEVAYTGRKPTKQEFSTAIVDGKGRPFGEHGGIPVVQESYKQHALFSPAGYEDEDHYRGGKILRPEISPIFQFMDDMARKGISKYGTKAIAKWGYKRIKEQQGHLKLPK